MTNPCSRKDGGGGKRTIACGILFFVLLLPGVMPNPPSCADTNKELRDIKGPVEAAPAYPLLAVSLVCFVLLGVYVFTRSNGTRSGNSLSRSPATGADGLLLLDELERGGFDGGKDQDFYSTLSDILRHHLESHQGIRATRMTADEILDVMRRDGAPPGFEGERLRSLLLRIDGVRFGGGGATDTEMREGLAAVRAFMTTART